MQTLPCFIATISYAARRLRCTDIIICDAGYARSTKLRKLVKGLANEKPFLSLPKQTYNTPSASKEKHQDPQPLSFHLCQLYTETLPKALHKALLHGKCYMTLLGGRG